MARGTIKQRITLDGGKEIKVELEQLGEAGAKAFKLLQEAAEKVKGPPAGFLKSLDDAAKKMKVLGESFRNAGKQMQDAGQYMTTRISAPIAALGVGIIKVAGDFEAGMNRIKAVSGATGDEINQVRELALKLGADTSFSAREAADGIEILLKNGLDLKQVFDGAAQSSLLLASATGSELAGAADVATDVLQSFRMSAGQMSGAVDQIVGTLTASKFGFDDYRLAIGQVAGVAGGLGVSFEDMNAVLAATSNLFASGSDAGTSFKTFLTRLVPESKKAAEVMKKYGLSFFDAAGNMRDMGDIAEELRAKLGGLNERELNEALKNIFGVDAMRSAIGLMRQGADGIETFRAAIAKGDAEAQATARMQGFNGSLEKLMGSLETLANRVADAGLLQWATDFVEYLDSLVDRLSKTSPGVFKFGTILAGVAAALGPVVWGIGTLLAQLGLASIGFSKLADLVVAARTGLISFRAALISTGIGAVVVAIGTGIALWATSTDSASTALEAHEKIISDVKSAYDKVGQSVAALAKTVRDQLFVESRENARKLGEELTNAVESVNQTDLFAFGRNNETFGKLITDLQSGMITVEKFREKVAAIGATSIDLDIQKVAADILEVITPLSTLSVKFQEASDFTDLLAGKMTDAAFKTKYYGQEAAAAAAAATQIGEASKTATKSVDDLGKAIRVRTSNEKGPLDEAYNLANGVAKAVDDGTASLDQLSESTDKSATKVRTFAEEMARIRISVPEELKGKNSPVNAIADSTINAKDKITEAFQEIPAAMENPFQLAKDKVISVVDQMKAGVLASIQSLSSSMATALANINAAVSQMEAAAQRAQLAGLSANSGAAGGGGGGFASGGYVSGPGTGTSDSIVARLSNGEFVVRAEAVRKYGAGLLSAINNMRLSPAALSSLKGFASGGLVQGGGSVDFSGLIDGLTVGMSHRSRMPAYASGGLVEAPRSGGRPINLTIGNETYEFQAREDVAEKLAKHIANGRLKSAGKRPSWG